jgi:alginate O-acetyltransferase complex protein AlgI
MLFNSFAFFACFLPLALLADYSSSRYSLRYSIIVLFLASVVFYSYWNISFLPVLVLSICVNYTVGRKICRSLDACNRPIAKRWLVTGLAFNLLLLTFFKYFEFLLSNIDTLIGVKFEPLGIVLPIGISFFTFTQIAYLADCNAGKVHEYKPENYGLFVTYFPHLIAGPIMHHKDMMPQFDYARWHTFSRGRLIVGLLFFVIGLFKKVILADGVARFVGPVFDVNYQHLTALEAWSGALAYTFQLYFDFSAYCDMAYGLSYMFGIILPINFDSPYKSTSIIEFWRRWHITLSTFLRDYLYVPLGGNRHGSRRRYINLIATMLLGGLWHGANWTFVIWGLLHGLYLTINHGIRRILGERSNPAVRGAGALLTFIAVVIGWVFFRAKSVASAKAILGAIVGHGGWLTVPGTTLGINRIMSVDSCLWWVAACAAIAFFLPNAYDMLGKGLQPEREQKLSGSLGAMLLGALLSVSLLLLLISEMRGVSEFLYFNF